MKLRAAKIIALTLMSEHKLEGWKFKFDSARSRFGFCKYAEQEITLSKVLTLLNDENRVRNTILHEIAHALVGKGHGHNHTWKTKAASIGCNAERAVPVDAIKINRPFQGVCANCGALPGLKRFRRLNGARHRPCNGIISWIKNSENK